MGYHGSLGFALIVGKLQHWHQVQWQQMTQPGSELSHA